MMLGLGDVATGLVAAAPAIGASAATSWWGYDPETDPTTGQTINCADPTNIFNATCWGVGAAVDTLAGPQQSITIPTPGVQPASPTDQQLQTVANSSNPGAAAQSLVNQLATQQTNAALLAQQQAVAAANPPASPSATCSGLLSPFLDPTDCGSFANYLPWGLLALGIVAAIEIFKR